MSDGYLVYQYWQDLAELLGLSDPHGQGLAEHLDTGIAAWTTSARRVAEAVSYGHGAANGWTVAGMVCAFPSSAQPTHRM